MHRLFCLAVVAGALSLTFSASAGEAAKGKEAAEKVSLEKMPVGQLVEALVQPDARRATLALDELGRRAELAREAVPALTKLLSGPQEGLRWRAARTLGAIGPAASDAVPALTKALADASPEVRGYAAFALGRIGKAAEPATDSLLQLVIDKEAQVRRAAMQALRAIGPDPEKTLPVLENILETADQAVVLPALETIAERGQAAVPRLRKFLQRPKLAYWACLVAAELGPDAAEAVPELTEVLKSEDPQIRLHALIALGNIGAAAKPAIPAITAALEKDAFEGVRFAAIYALVQLGEKSKDVNAALADAAQHKDPLLRLLGLWGLAKLNREDLALAKQATEEIIANLGAKDARLRKAAARCLHEFHGAPEIIRPALIAALKDADLEVVDHALDALAGLGPQAVTNIGPALQEKGLRHFATRLIYRLGDKAEGAVPALLDALKQPVENPDDGAFRKEVQLALAAIGPAAKPAIPELLKSLESKDEEVFVSACYVLGKIGPAAATDSTVPRTLRKKLEDSEGRSQPEKVAVVWTLLKLLPNSPRLPKFAAPLLTGALNSDRELVRAECAKALGDLGDEGKPAISRLKELLQDESPLVRDAASEALRKLGAGG